MSWEAVQWANKQRLRLPQEQFVLMLLANCADPEGLAFGWWKSKDHWWTYLAERSRLSRGTVFRHIATIVEHGLARRQKVIMPDGVARSTLVLDLSKTVIVDAEDIDSPATAEATEDHSERVSPARLSESHQRDSASLTSETQRVSPARLHKEYNKEDSNKDSEREARARDGLEKLKAMSVTSAADDPTKVGDAWNRLPENEHQAALDGYPLWLAEFRSLGRKYVPSLEKYIDRRNWKGLKPGQKPSPEHSAKPAPKSYAPESPEACALVYLARMARAPLLQLNSGKIAFTGEITPRILAFATEPPATKRVGIGSGQFRAWDDLFAQVFGGKRARLTGVDVPFEWPPRKDGSIIAPGTDPPGTLSDEDARAFSVT